ncbi:MAG: putative rane protein [Frondihabitans sp.]|nr:putative rane protein [Frondihabitans sp.]
MLALGILFALIALAVLAAVVLPIASAMVVFCLIALVPALVVGVLVVGAFRARGDRHLKRALRLYASAGPVVVLQDLARGRTDAKGTGTALLASAIRDPVFAAAATILAIAVTDDIAARYCEAGMTRVAPDSRVVVRERADENDGQRSGD